MQLVPHLLLRTDSGVSPLAIALRDAGYLVTKAGDDEYALHLAGTLNVDAIVAELPSFGTIRFARALPESIAATIPIMLVASAPDVVRKSVMFDVLHASSSDLVGEIDLTLARWERNRRAAI